MIATLVLAEVVTEAPAATAASAVAVVAQWHDFYLLMGTAAVTLVGLLFVSLSFHLDVVLHESKQHLLSHARETLLSFIYVLTVSLLFEVPNEGIKVISVGVTVASLVPLVLTVRALLRGRGHADGPRMDNYVVRRRLLMMFCLALMAVFSVRMLITRSPDNLFGMVGLLCAMIGNAVGSSWDLLVQVGRIKRAQAEAEARG